MSFYNEIVKFVVERKQNIFHFETGVTYNNYKPPFKKEIHFKDYPDYFVLKGLLNVKNINKSVFECKEHPDGSLNFLTQIFKYVTKIRTKNHEYVSFNFVVVCGDDVKYLQIYVGCKSLDFSKINLSEISCVLKRNKKFFKNLEFGGLVCVSDKTLHRYGSFQDYLYGTWDAEFDDHKALETAILDSFGPYIPINHVERG